MDIKEIRCHFSGVNFRCIHQDDEADITDFIQWANQYKEKLDNGTKICMALDCEGVDLGTAPKSLLCVQIGQIYSDNCNLLQMGMDKKPEPVDPKPGMIVFFSKSHAANPELVALMGEVLSHENMTLVTFDFINDIGALREAGVAVSTDNLIDAQLYVNSPRASIGYIRNRKAVGIKKTLERIEESKLFSDDALVGNVIALQDKKVVNWSAKFFIMNVEKLAAESMVTPDFLEYAAGDVVCTGVILSYVIAIGKFFDMWKESAQKVWEYERMCSRQPPNPVLPCWERKFSFTQDKKIEEIKTQTPEMLEENLTDCLKLYQWAEDIIALANNNYTGAKSRMSEAKKQMRVTRKILMNHIDELKELAGMQ